MQKALKNLKKDISIQELKRMQNRLEDSLDKKQRRLPGMAETLTSHTILPKINLNLSYEKTKHNLDEVFNYRSRSAQDTNKAHHESFSRPASSLVKPKHPSTKKRQLINVISTDTMQTYARGEVDNRQGRSDTTLLSQNISAGGV